MIRLILLLVSHTVVGLVGFAAGFYLLPILSAPPAPSDLAVQDVAEKAGYVGEFRRDLADSDALHWGEGSIHVGRESIALKGEISPGPAYMLYLSPEFVETEVDFLRLKPKMALVGDVKTFENFIVPVPATVDPSQFDTVVIWCESFSQFITAASYR